MIYKRNAPGRWHGARAQVNHYTTPNSNPARPVAEYAARGLASILGKVSPAQHAAILARISALIGGAK